MSDQSTTEINSILENAKQQLRERAAPRWEAHPEQVEISGKKAFLRDHPEQAIPLSDLFAILENVFAIVVRGTFLPSATLVRPQAAWAARSGS